MGFNLKEINKIAWILSRAEWVPPEYSRSKKNCLEAILLGKSFGLDEVESLFSISLSSKEFDGNWKFSLNKNSIFPHKTILPVDPRFKRAKEVLIILANHIKMKPDEKEDLYKILISDKSTIGELCWYIDQGKQKLLPRLDKCEKEFFLKETFTVGTET